MGDSVLLHIPSDIKLLMHTCSDETVVYNCASGETHLLETLAADLLRELEAGPLSRRQCAELLERWHPEADSAERAAYLEALLSRFEALGLVEMPGQFE